MQWISISRLATLMYEGRGDSEEPGYPALRQGIHHENSLERVIKIKKKKES